MKMPSHSEVKIYGGKETADLPHLIEIEPAGPDSGAGVEIRKQTPDLLEARGVLRHVSLVFPAFLQNNSNHRFQKQGVRTGTDRQMHVGNLRRFGSSGINDDEQFVRIFGDPLELRGAWESGGSACRSSR